jgi:hypothetical protein
MTGLSFLAATTGSATSSLHEKVLIAVIVGIPLAVFLMWRGGEGIVPALGGIGTAFLLAWIVRGISPAACLAHTTCKSYSTTEVAVGIAVSLGVAFLLAELRDIRRKRRARRAG